jgi:tetratricopeptide (TPR) repeat protein
MGAAAAAFVQHLPAALRAAPAKRPRTPHACARDPPPAVDAALSRRVSERLEAAEAGVAAAPGDMEIVPRGAPARIRSVLPVQVDLWCYHARLAARRRRWSEAEGLWRRCIGVNSADGRPWLGLARMYAKRGEEGKAERMFREGVLASRRNPFLLQAWGVFEEKRGAVGRAKALFEAAVRADSEHVASWVALGLWEQRHGKGLYAARECFKNAAEGKGGGRNYYVWHVWGMVEKELGDFEAARRCFETGVGVNPKNGATYVVWGVLEEQLGNYDEAIRLFEVAQKVSPRNAHALVAHAVALERGPRRDIVNARRLLRQAGYAQPRDAAVFQTAGSLEARAGDFEAAREMFRRGIEANPRHVPVWLAWGMLEEEAGDIAQARELFQEGVWAHPGASDVVRLWHAWAGLERRARQVDAARKLYGHGLRASPNSIAVLSCWAAMEAEQRNMPFARDMLERAVALEPTHRDLWKLYESLEREHGSDARADAVRLRARVFQRQRGKRLVVSEPLPGDFAASGMWIAAEDLREENLADAIPEGGVEDEAEAEADGDRDGPDKTGRGQPLGSDHYLQRISFPQTPP